MFQKDRQYTRFCAYGFLKNLRFFDPFLILFLKDAGLTYTQIGVLYAIREITRNLLEIPGGVFADTVGRIISMVTAFGAYLISFILFYFSGSFWAFAIAFVFFAFGDAFRTGTHKSIIMSYLNLKGWSEWKVDYYGHTRSWSQLGSGISALLAGLMILLTQNYRLAFVLSVIPYVLNLINLATYPAQLNKPGGSTSQISIRQQLRSTLNDFALAFKDRKVWKSIIGLSSYTGYYKASKDYIQPLIQAFALSLPLSLPGSDIQREAVFIGSIYFLLFVSTSWMTRHSGRWARKTNSTHKSMTISLLLGASSGIFSGILVLLGLNALAIISFFGIYIFENLRKPIGIGQIAGQLDEKVLASALSVESQAETVFAALFAIMIGFIVDRFELGPGFIATGLVIIVLFVLFLRRKKPTTGNES